MNLIVTFVFRIILTVVFGLIGLRLALPLSYFFQGSIYNEMGYHHYVNGGISSVAIGADFGAVDVYRTTVFVVIFSAVILGYLIGHWIIKKQSILNN